MEDLRDGLGLSPVRFETRLGLALVGLRRVRVRQNLRLVAVWRLTDVPAISDVGAEPAPGLFQRVEDFVLGDGLVDAALENALCTAAGQGDRLVRREERHVRAFEFSFDGQALERPARDTRDALTDDDVERPGMPWSFFEKVGDTACSRDGDVEAVVVRPAASVVQGKPAGLDVVEVGHDHPRVRYRGLTVGQLAQHRLARILQVLGGSPAEEGHPDLVPEQGRGHAQGGYGVVGQPGRPGDVAAGRRRIVHLLERRHGGGSSLDWYAAHWSSSLIAELSRARRRSPWTPETVVT
ncbi:hypothetical protein [Amycolatopsis sp. cmx-11-12]|uniref:hypothetical protein n=1 Tax=Amycolatopsis sp. cmx-11-12 TaxID=2785795 RepID=UPI0039185265